MLNAAFSEKDKNKDESTVFINTNARSLGPKLDSLADNLRELSCCAAVVTETRFDFL